jgi:hypothetical protein
MAMGDSGPKQHRQVVRVPEGWKNRVRSAVLDVIVLAGVKRAAQLCGCVNHRPGRPTTSSPDKRMRLFKITQPGEAEDK